jgi:hypothetical protein
MKMFTVKAEITFSMYTGELSNAYGDYHRFLVENIEDCLISVDKVEIAKEEELS